METDSQYMEHKFPQIKPHPFSKVFRPRTDQSAITLISLLLEYTPTARLSAPQALVNEFFDELRVEGVMLPNGHDMPALFNFTKEGESSSFIGCEGRVRVERGRRWLKGKRENNRQTEKETGDAKEKREGEERMRNQSKEFRLTPRTINPT